MKKYLYSALALPLLFACSSEDFDEKVISNDQFAGIAKVDATFSMNEGPKTRFDAGDGSWVTEEGDLWGFAWMAGGEAAATLPIDGKAYQNHNLIQTNGIFTPQTSIYVGNYFIYRPYDATTVKPQAINFTSLVEQPLVEGYASTTQAWKNLGKTAINIGDKWTQVTAAGTADAEDPTFTWNKAGIKQHYEINAALFSNQTGLDLTYANNNITFPEAKDVEGATDIVLNYAAGTEVGAADIYEVTVDPQSGGASIAANSFTYAPTVEPNGAVHDGKFWATKKNLAAVTLGNPGDGFTFTNDVITLTNNAGVSTGANGSKAWFWFNSLPVTAGDATTATNVQTILSSSFGKVTVNGNVGDIAYAFDYPTNTSTSREWIKLAAADDLSKTPKEWDVSNENTFVNQYGNHKGKYVYNVDFSTADMDQMHVKNDAHLQKCLKYYIAAGKTGPYVLYLDKDDDGEFKISKISIALIQTINAGGVNVTVQACTDPAHTPAKIVITQDGQTGELANATEVPELDDVFAAPTNVFLAKNTTWTWKERTAPAANVLAVDDNVSSITNEGTLTVNASNIELYNTDTDAKATTTLTNAAGATMNITQVTTVKNQLTNLGTINVGSESNTAPELRAYGVQIKNDATKLNKCGVINNYGVVGVTDGVAGGSVNNYGLIDMKSTAAITLLSSNELVSNFDNVFNKNTNKMGTVVLPNGQPNALVSVSNAAETGFIKYNWTGANYSTPNNGVVKYNTIVVSSDIAFSYVETEIKYIEFNGTRTQVTNPYVGGVGNKLTQLKGVIINAGKSIIIEKDNGLNCLDGAFLGTGATVYNGGTFNHNAAVDPSDATKRTNYFGKWSITQIVKY